MRIRFLCCGTCRELDAGERCRQLDHKEFDDIPDALKPPLHGACFCVLVELDSQWPIPSEVDHD